MILSPRFHENDFVNKCSQAGLSSASYFPSYTRRRGGWLMPGILEFDGEAAAIANDCEAATGPV
jgi:hypothetical protein